MNRCTFTLPRPGSIGLGEDGIERALCWCKCPLVRVVQPGRQDHWRHTSKVKDERALAFAMTPKGRKVPT